MKNNRAVAAAIAALLPFTGAALAQNTPAESVNDELRREIEEQKQRLAVLERKLEIQQEAAAASAPAGTPPAAAPAPAVSDSPTGASGPVDNNELAKGLGIK